jgi:small-conductance mechanosensitive channel
MTGDLAGWGAGTALTAAAAALVVMAAGWLARRLAHRHPAVVELILRARWPARATFAAAAVRARVPGAPLAEASADAWTQVASLVLIAATAWLAIRALSVIEPALMGRFDVTPRDNRRARALRTQVQILRRVGALAVVVVALVAALRTSDWGRDLGTSLLAVSGIIAAVAGVAGRSTVGNVIAGLQIAFAEPIRLDDVVVIEGEWGNVEEITLTYVVVRVWDERRLVLPTGYFVEQPFQNWTRERSEIVGAVELWVDYAAPVDAVRAELDQLVAGSPRWDGRVVNLQVTDTSPHAMKLRALVSAADGPTAWDLRCEVREGLVRWLAAHHPQALPQLRTSAGLPAGGRAQ